MGFGRLTDMSIKKYDIAKDFKRGIVSRIQFAANDWDKETDALKIGWAFANNDLSPIILDGVNKYLESIGEEKIGMINIQETEKHEKIRIDN